MKKRYSDSGRGLALLALRPSGKLKKSVLGENFLHDSHGSDYHHGDRRVARPNIGKKSLSSRPTASSMSLIALLALLALDSNQTNPLRGSSCTNGFSNRSSSDFSPNSMGSVVVSMRRTGLRGCLQYPAMQVRKHYVRTQLTQYLPRLIHLI